MAYESASRKTALLLPLTSEDLEAEIDFYRQTANLKVIWKRLFCIYAYLKSLSGHIKRLIGLSDLALSLYP